MHLITASGGTTTNRTLGTHTAAIKEITVQIPQTKLGGGTPSSALQLMAATLVEENVEHALKKKSVKAQGMTLLAQEGNGPDEIRIELDPAVADISFPLIDRLAAVATSEGMVGIAVRFDFVDGIDAVVRHHSLTGRLFGAGIHLTGEGDLAYKSLTFTVAHLLFIGTHQSRRGGVYLRVTTRLASLPLVEVRELMDILFEREVLYLADE